MKKNKNISIYDAWHNEKQEALFFSAADAIWIGYKNYPFPSGVLYQAISLKKPSIVSSEGFINHLNKKYKIGISCDINSPNNILDAVYKIKNPKNLKFLKKNISKFLFVCDRSIWTKKFRNFILNTI